MGKMMAAASGTPSARHMATLAQQKNMLTWLRRGENALCSGKGDSTDARRSEALEFNAYKEWFDGWCEFLVANDFGEWRQHPTLGRVVYIPRQKRRRIINPDETHTVMSTELEHGGPRANVYHDPKLGAPARPSVTNARHVSAMYSVNAAGEVLPIYFEFDSSAQDENFKIHPSWVIGLPRPIGRWGHDKDTELQCACEVSSKGGTQSGSFLNWIVHVIESAYPNIEPQFRYDEHGPVDEDGLTPILAGPVIIKTDLGPDRVEKDEAGLLERQGRHKKGQLAYPGFPNGSGSNQEMDRLFAYVKQKNKEIANDIVSERESEAADARRELLKQTDGSPSRSTRSSKRLPPINLTNADLPRIINGRSNDPPEKRPYCHALSPERVLGAFAAVGAVDADGWVTAASLHDPKVRRSAPTPAAAAGAGAEEMAAPLGRGCRGAAAAAVVAPPAKAAAAPSEKRAERTATAAAQLEKALSAIGSHGVDAHVFAPPPPKAPSKAKGGGAKGKGKAAMKENTSVVVAEPTDVEQELSRELTSGVTGFAVWQRAKVGGMWCDEVLVPVLEAIRAEKARAGATKVKKDEAFTSLRQEAINILDGCISIEFLPTADLKTLTRYARGTRTRRWPCPPARPLGSKHIQDGPPLTAGTCSTPPRRSA
jgi:hypothetical protein